MKKILFTLILCALAFSAGAQDFKPFILNGGAEYKTLQEAIDNAPSGSASTIKVKPCPPDIAEYGSAYSTNIVSNINAHGCEIFTHSKSLTIEGQAGGALPILKDFVIVLESTVGTKPDYTFSNLAFSGKSIIVVDNKHGNFGKLEVFGCYADVTNCTAKFPTLKNKDSVGATYASGTFIQWLQRSVGTTDEFLFHDNEIITRLSQAGGNVRVFNGGMMTKSAVIRDNVFGSEAHPIEGSSAWLAVSQCTAKDAVIEFRDNTVYGKGYVGMYWILATGVTATGLDVSIHDNMMLIQNIGRPRFDASGDGDLLVYVSSGYSIGGNIRSWRNYVNGYCFNEVINSIGDAVVVDKQVGHTDGDGHIHSIESGPDILVRRYGIKKDDIYLLNKADNYQGVTHNVIDLGNSMYCDRCDVILSAITVKCTGLADGESVFFDIIDAGGAVVGTVALSGGADNGSGVNGGAVSRTIAGIEPGIYTVAPSGADWSWTYAVPAAVTKTIAALNDTASQSEFTYEFSLAKKSGIKVKNAENVKIDNMN